MCSNDCIITLTERVDSSELKAKCLPVKKTPIYLHLRAFDLCSIVLKRIKRLHRLYHSSFHCVLRSPNDVVCVPQVHLGRVREALARAIPAGKYFLRHTNLQFSRMPSQG